jgi:pyruvate formate lyase activating enzyme
VGALTLYGRKITVMEAENLLSEDLVFYRQSGGGVTLSGGEPLLQADFCAALLQRLKKYDIHCAVDTCGAVPFSAFEKVLPYTDLFLYDLKHIDPALHWQYTGQDNATILDNLRQLDETGKPIEIRIPVIPGVNDSKAAMRRSGEFLSQLRHVSGVKLLTYNPFAQDKYAALDLPYYSASISITV